MRRNKFQPYVVVCPCVQKVAYAISRMNTPDSLFFKYECSVHSSGSETTEGNGRVKCHLLPDVVLTGSENVNYYWYETYYGGSMGSIISTLKRGELLMQGDHDFDGSLVAGGDTIKGSIITYKTIENAERITPETRLEHNSLIFKVILQLRQRSSFGRAGPGKWATNRRGSILIESVIIRVLKGKSLKLPIVTALPLKLYFMKCECPTQQQAFNFLKTYKVPPAMLDCAYHRCYCRSCYADNLPKFRTKAGEKYTVPVGWARFGLAVNPVFAQMNSMWSTWNTAYHGCKVDNVESILKHRTLLIPKDYCYDGRRLGVANSRDPNQKSYFVTPSIEHAAHPRFGQYVRKNDLVFQVAIAFKVRPDVTERQEENEDEVFGNNNALVVYDYSEIPKNGMEWYSSQRGCVHPFAILVRIITDCQLEANAATAPYEPNVN